MNKKGKITRCIITDHLIGTYDIQFNNMVSSRVILSLSSVLLLCFKKSKTDDRSQT